MGDEGIDLKGRARLSQIISDKQKDIERFTDGFLLTIKRNQENGIITEYEAKMLRMELTCLLG